MSTGLKYAIYGVLGLIGLVIAVNLLTGLLIFALKVLVPIILVLGVGYVVYRIVDRKALGSGPPSIR